MPSIRVADGTQLWYEDSGPVADQTHVTLVLVHGFGFNGGVFKNLFPVAPKYHFRTIAIHRPGYPPSSSLSEQERQISTGDVDQQIKGLHYQGMQLVEFLYRLIEVEGIPQMAGERQGGIALLGWSLGSMLIHAFLSCLDQASKDWTENLAKYLHTTLLFDPSAMTIGFHYPIELDPTFLFSEDPKVLFEGCKKYLSGYYTHDDTRSRNLDTLNMLLIPTSPPRPPTFHDLTLEEMLPVLVPGASLPVDLSILALGESCGRQIVRRAIFDGALAAQYLPHLRVRYFHGENSAGILIAGLWFLERGLEEVPGPYDRVDGQGRDVRILGAMKGNHFHFWDDPEGALEQWRRCIDS